MGKFKISQNQERVLAMMASRLPDKYISEAPTTELVSGEFLFLSGIDEDTEGNPIVKEQFYDVAVPKRRTIDHLNRLRKVHKSKGRDGVFEYIMSYLKIDNASEESIKEGEDQLREYLYDSGNYEDSQIKFVRKNTLYKIAQKYNEIRDIDKGIEKKVASIRRMIKMGEWGPVKKYLGYYTTFINNEKLTFNIPVRILDEEVFAIHMKDPSKINKAKYIMESCDFDRRKLEVLVDKLINYIGERKLEGTLDQRGLDETDLWLNKTYQYINL